MAEVRERLQMTDEELREDLDVLNVVNFGGGSYVLYAEVQGDEIEVDPEPYSDNFARPARLLPLEAKALVAAIDLLGDHLPEGSLASARQKIVKALGEDPSQEGLQIAPSAADDPDLARTINQAIVDSRMVSIEYYKENEDEFTERTIEPYALINGRGGLVRVQLRPGARRHPPLPPRPHQAAEGHAQDVRAAARGRPERRPRGLAPHRRRASIAGGPRVDRTRAGPLGARAPRRAEELADGALVVELPFAGVHWLVREVLKEAGDAAVIEPEDARVAVHDAARALAGKRKRAKAAA